MPAESEWSRQGEDQLTLLRAQGQTHLSPAREEGGELGCGCGGIVISIEEKYHSVIYLLFFLRNFCRTSSFVLVSVLTHIPVSQCGSVYKLSQSLSQSANYSTSWSGLRWITSSMIPNSFACSADMKWSLSTLSSVYCFGGKRAERLVANSFSLALLSCN